VEASRTAKNRNAQTGLVSLCRYEFGAKFRPDTRRISGDETYCDRGHATSHLTRALLGFSKMHTYAQTKTKRALLRWEVSRQ
jgi:hypothetical protein